jgi:hypothetical protein
MQDGMVLSAITQKRNKTWAGKNIFELQTLAGI